MAERILSDMAEQGKKSGGIQLMVGLPDEPLRPMPEAANFFHLSRLEQDFQLLVGYLDLERVASLSGTGAREADMQAELTHRFLIPWRALFQLRDRIEDMIAVLRAQGVAVPEIRQGTKAQNSDG